MIKNLEKFREELEKINSWWIDRKVDIPLKKEIKRETFKEVLHSLNLRRITIITGPRRVGKTVMIKQIIRELIEKNDERNFLYYSLDDPSLFTYSDDVLKDMIDYFLENIAREGKKYIFLDEVHLYKDWHKWIKAYYDREKDVKFVLSGSSSLALQREANEYLKGRTISFELYPLSFREFLELNDIAVEEFDFENIENIMKKNRLRIKKLFNTVKHSFEEFLLVGGFPEWFEVKDARKWYSMLIEDIPKRAIYEDVARIFNIRNTKILESMLAFIVANQSRILSYEAVNEVAGLDRGTLLNYIEYIKTSYLVIEILKYAKNVKTQLKSMKKYLVIDQGLRNALLKDYEVKETNIGLIVENVIGLHLLRIAKRRNLKLFYIRTDDEIDFLIKDKESIPVEVKHRENITKKDVLPLLKFMEKSKHKIGIVITKDLFERQKIDKKEILFIPTWLFLLIS